MRKTILFIAGDPSGDINTAPIIQKLKSKAPELICTGVGGPAMERAGFIKMFPFEPFNKMGIAEVLPSLPFFLNVKKQLIDYMKKERPSCIVCVDYSGFNIPIMKAAYEIGIPVVWYIAPMVWAWKKKRAKILGKFASYICCIFPFEPSFFMPYTSNVAFVGNPVAETFMETTSGKNISKKFTKDPLLAIIPGSRIQEIKAVLKPMVDAYKILKEKYPTLRAVISRYKTLPEEIFKKECEEETLEIFSGELNDLLERSNVALVTSGTATLQTALYGIPHVIVYKTSLLTYLFFKNFLKISWIGLPNIIKGESVVPECIQNDVKGEILAQKIEPFLMDEDLYCQTSNKLIEIREILSREKPSERVSDVIIRTLNIS